MNEYRYVFINEPVLDTEPLVNTEHGLFAERGHARNVLEFYNDFMDEVRKINIADRYIFTSFLQADCSVIFFINQNEQTFGFFYWCAERFVCPIERLISISCEGYGHVNEYEHYDKPEDLKIIVKYLGNKNTEEQFEIKLTTRREYIKLIGRVMRIENAYENVQANVANNTIKLFRLIRDNLENYRKGLNTNVALPVIDYQAKTQAIYEANNYYNYALNFCIDRYFD